MQFTDFLKKYLKSTFINFLQIVRLTIPCGGGAAHKMYMAYSSLMRTTEMGGVEADICGDELAAAGTCRKRHKRCDLVPLL